MERHLAAWITAERGRFVLFLPVFMGVGVIAYFSLVFEPALWPSCLCAGGAALIAVLARSWALLRAASLCVLFAALGFGSATLATWRAPPGERLPFVGVTVAGVVSGVEMLPVGRRILVAAPSLDGAPPLARSVRIRLRTTDRSVLAPGDRVSLRALLRAPSPPDYPGGWDTQRDSFFSGIAGYGFAIGTSTMTEKARTGGWQGFRAAIAARVMAALPGTRGAIAATLLTGIGAAIPQDDRSAFQNSGLAHLLAVAGLHIGIVMGLIFGSVRLGLAAWERAALFWPTRQIAALAALAAGGFYLALTGAHVPILRSFVMAALVTLGVLTGRRAVSLRALGLAAVALMLAAPWELMGVSFQMSFSAVLALIAGYEALRPAIARIGPGAWWRRPALHVGGLAMTSLLAGTASLPFAMYHFGKATLWYVPANLLAVPLTAFWVLPLGIASLPLMPLGWERLALVPMGWGIGAIVSIAHGVAAWPAASLPVPRIPAWCLCLVAAGLVWTGLWRSSLRLLGGLPLGAGLLAPLFLCPPDILVGPDAGVIAVRSSGRILVEVAKRVSAFGEQAPERLWGAATKVALDCARPACPIAIGDATVLLVHDAVAEIPCAGAAFLVSAAPLRGACPGVPRIDRFTLWDGGAAFGWARAPPAILTDGAVRGDRPWVPRPHLRLATAE